MDTIFTPPKRAGLIFHFTGLVLLFAGSLLTILQANRAEIGPMFSLWLVIFLFVALPIPLLFYRAYALQRASYHVSPEGIRINWGLRTEEIPMGKILWLSPDIHLERPLPRPWLFWPGGVVGVRKVSGGEVEYMAVRTRALIIIATPGKMYAISPEHPEAFLRSFHRQAEIGALTPIIARSVYPRFVVGSVWANRGARTLILTGFVLILAFFLWLSFSFPTVPTLALSRAQFFLIPVVNGLFFLINLLLGLFFFRSPQSQPLAYLLWGTSVLVSLLFFGAFVQLLY
ncbi:MAG: hypothetical protein H6636_07995 [Anaerolineales bacterium]|nr:hypothetical protein [Anaerolineales bacterium]